MRVGVSHSFVFMGDAHEKVKALAAEAAGGLGYEVVDVELKRAQRRSLLRVIIDKEGGVTLGDCESMSRTLTPLLDIEDPIEGPYVIEVSSPGLDRPLKGPRDFQRETGKLARVTTKEPVDNRTFFIGRITAATDEAVSLVDEKSAAVTISFDNISKARLEIEI